MKYVIMILFIMSLMGCTTLKYEENLQAPYLQKEVELIGVTTIAFTVFLTAVGGVIYSKVQK